MENREKTDSEKLDRLYIEVLGIKATLEGDPTKGVKPPFERLFDKFDELPCNNHLRRIDALEDAQMVNCAVNKERKRLIGTVKSLLLRIGLPVGAGGGIVAWLEKLFG